MPSKPAPIPYQFLVSWSLFLRAAQLPRLLGGLGDPLVGLNTICSQSSSTYLLWPFVFVSCGLCEVSLNCCASSSHLPDRVRRPKPEFRGAVDGRGSCRLLLHSPPKTLGLTHTGYLQMSPARRSSWHNTQQTPLFPHSLLLSWILSFTPAHLPRSWGSFEDLFVGLNTACSQSRV